MGGGEPKDSAGSEGKLTGNIESTKDLCRQEDGRVQFRDWGLGFSMVTTISTVLLEEEWSRETEIDILWVIQSHHESRKGGIRARAPRG